MSTYQSFSFWLLKVSVLSGLLIFLLWLSLHPSIPNYTIVEFTIPIDTSNNSVSFGLEVSNDNNGGEVYYNDINVTMYFANNNIGTTVLPSFSQGHEKTTRVTGNVVVGERVLKEVVRAVTDGTADLKLGLSMTVKYRIWNWRSKVHHMLMEAGVKVGKNGKVSAKKKKIKMHRCHKKLRKRLYISGSLH